jgi:hypothetical protein
MGSFPHVSRSGTESGYLPPYFPVPSWWLHKVKQKQHYCLNVRTLIPSMHPALSFEIKEYLPWSKSCDSYFVIKEEPGHDINLMILPPILPGLSVVPGYSFPIFSTKANALFYGRLTILLTDLHSSLFSTVIRESQKKGMSLLRPPTPTYILLISQRVIPLSFLYIQENNAMFGFLDPNYSIVEDSVIKYSS